MVHIRQIVYPIKTNLASLAAPDKLYHVNYTNEIHLTIVIIKPTKTEYIRFIKI